MITLHLYHGDNPSPSFTHSGPTESGAYDAARQLSGDPRTHAFGATRGEVYRGGFRQSAFTIDHDGRLTITHDASWLIGGAL